MANDHQLQTATARCLSILLRYRNGEKSEATKSTMVAEIETVAGWLMELGPPPGVLEAGVVRPVEDYLLARFGHEAGLRLYSEFVEAFEVRELPRSR